MKTLSLFTTAIMFAMTSTAQKTTDSSSNHANSQWKQNSDQPRHQKKSNQTYNKWNKNDSSSTRFNGGLDSNKNYNQDNNMRRPVSNMNKNRRHNRMNYAPNNNRSSVDSI